MTTTCPKPDCEEPIELDADCCDLDCPHCGAWLVTERDGGPLVVWKSDDVEWEPNELADAIRSRDAEERSFEYWRRGL